MEREEFEVLVDEAIESIPDEFRKRIDNVAILVEDMPTLHQRVKLRLRRGMTLFGLYEGVSLLNRGMGYSGVLPDRITIFQRPIEYAATSREDLKEIIKHTVWHEIAHHFGMNEEAVRKAEAARRRAQ